MTTEQAYRLLGLQAPATAEQVKKAYRRLALESHPDRFSTAEDKAYYEKRFMQVHEAYAQLRAEAVVELQAEPMPEPDFGPKTAGRSFAPDGFEEVPLAEKLGLGVQWRLGPLLFWGVGIPAAFGVLVYFVKSLIEAVRSQ